MHNTKRPSSLCSLKGIDKIIEFSLDELSEQKQTNELNFKIK
jgi:hypothetical protein